MRSGWWVQGRQRGEVVGSCGLMTWRGALGVTESGHVGLWGDTLHHALREVPIPGRRPPGAASPHGQQTLRHPPGRECACSVNPNSFNPPPHAIHVSAFDILWSSNLITRFCGLYHCLYFLPPRLGILELTWRPATWMVHRCWSGRITWNIGGMGGL